MTFIAYVAFTDSSGRTSMSGREWTVNHLGETVSVRWF